MHRDLLSAEYLSWLAFLNGTYPWNEIVYQEYTLSNLKRMLLKAYYQTTGYRHLYDEHGFHPSDLNSIQDVNWVPFTTKEMIRDRLGDFTVNVPDKQYVATSGSTGIPLGVYRTPVSFARDLASKAYFYHWYGWSEQDRCIRLRGEVLNSEVIDTSDHVELREEYNELRFSSYHLTPKNMAHYYERTVEYDPSWLKCYPSTGFAFAQWMKDNGKQLNLKGVLCASEKLYPHQKALMGEVFDCRVTSHYGHYEAAVLAGYCEHADHYHVLPQYGYAEVLDAENKPVSRGARGEIIATSFIDEATLFIRYRTQDMAVYLGDRCPACGRPFQVWEDIDGRFQEHIISKDGRYIPLTGLRFPDGIFDHVREFQFRQSGSGPVTMLITLKKSWNADVLAYMQSTLEHEFAGITDITICPVDSIERTSRAKRRLLIREDDSGDAVTEA